ncbi:hypothetical protein LR48_Vigan07g174100 [Vigna angularis]|uniref:Uncharacterized protein n=1 Tax=Phaseolus angularis TaxID=3914 RepID=A0A0L9UZN5_PHAAN|nr:uncharacterized protein HKW66_Vig0125550 [Vigna angularis]KOM48037.1 hypothetical protein LR48_Vigan07g174100 [Vigna angularis]
MPLFSFFACFPVLLPPQLRCFLLCCLQPLQTFLLPTPPPPSAAAFISLAHCSPLRCRRQRGTQRRREESPLYSLQESDRSTPHLVTHHLLDRAEGRAATTRITSPSSTTTDPRSSPSSPTSATVFSSSSTLALFPRLPSAILRSVHEVESRGRGTGGGLTVKTNPTAGGRVNGGIVGLVTLGDGGSRDVVAARGTGGGRGGKNRVAEGSVGVGIEVSLALGGVTGALLDILRGGRLAGIEVMLRMNGMRKEEGVASMRVGLGKMNGGEGRSCLVCGRGFEARNPCCFGG